MVRSKIFFITALLLLLLSSCNVPSEQTSTPTLTPGSTPTQTTNQTFTPTIQPEATATPIQTPAPPDHTTVLTLPSIADIVERIKPAVVYISVQYYDSSFLFRSWSTRSGSGVILNPDGYILTNNHVVEDASEIEVLLPDGEFTYKAEIIGTDPLSDLAVIKIDGGNFPAAGFADASKLRVGDWVIAMGSPVSTIIGAEGGPSVTIGIVSNLERSFSLDESAFYDIIQTDAAINPGNSGGPLINIDGEVIGINAMIIQPGTGIGFAIPINMAKDIYRQLKESGSVVRGFLGVVPVDVERDMMEFAQKLRKP